MAYDAKTFLESLYSDPIGSAEANSLPDPPVGSAPCAPCAPALSVDEYEDLTPDDLPEDWRFHYLERVALMQPDENPVLEHIESAAFSDTLRVMKARGIDPRSNRRNGAGSNH